MKLIEAKENRQAPGGKNRAPSGNAVKQKFSGVCTW
jgi:hypothetical protein